MRAGKDFKGEKPRNFKQTLKKLQKHLTKYKISLIIVMVLACGSAAFSIVGPRLLGNVTNEVFAGLMSRFAGGGGIDFSAIGKMLIFVLGLYVISAMFSYAMGWLMTGIAQKVAYRLRNEVSEKIHKMPFKAFDGKPHGDVMSIITNDIDTLSQNLNQSVTQVISSLIMVVGVIVMMLTIDVIITLIALLILPLSIIIVSLLVKVSQKHFKNERAQLGRVNGQVEEAFGALGTVAAFNAHKRVLDSFDDDNDRLYRSAFRSMGYSGLMMPIMLFIGNLCYVAVAIVGGLFIIRGRILPGDIQAFIQYIRQLTHPLSHIAQMMGMLQSTTAAAERVFEFLELPDEAFGGNRPAGSISGNVELRNVKFGYDNEKVIINNFSATIKQGQKIAIVGQTGAGKTTLIKLLMRFYDVDSGAIEIDGINLCEYDKSAIRKAFGMVLQDTWLFNGSILDNIKYSRPGASDSDAIAAAKCAHAHNFIKALPGGYNMEINEEISNISQGQKQLLTIARAILADPKILILDEATSSVDTLTEAKIQKAMDTLMAGRTSFIIAHRLSTIVSADLIFVIKDGDIIEQGNHSELIGKNGFYSQLYNSQFV
jgi:ATP-binding cassette subfamily B protein